MGRILKVENPEDYAPGGQWGNRLGASVDSYQANLYDTARAGASALGADGAASWLDAHRVRNEQQAAMQRAVAQRQGAVMSYKDVDSVGSGLNYLGGLAVDSAPYLAEAAIGGVAGRGLAMATRSAGMPAAVEAARGARYATAGAVTASYPSSVGDVMSSQREQSGRTDDASAAALGVPYAALNAFGLEGALARKEGFNIARGLDDARRFGAAKRLGANAALTGLSEGASEMGQELVNQAGRNVVDPSAGYGSPEAIDRYAESFVGGAVLGGAGAGVGGGWRKHGGTDPRQTQPANPTDPGATLDLLGGTGTGRPDFDLQPPPGAYPPAPATPAAPAQLRPRSPITEQYDLFNPDGTPTYGADQSFGEYGQDALPEGAPDGLPMPRGLPLSFEGDPAFAGARPGAARYSPAPQMPAGAPGAQTDMFDPLMEAPNEYAPPAMEAPRPGPTDGAAPLLDSRPSSTVRTDYGLPQIRQRLMAATGRLDGFTAKLATATSQAIEDPDNALQMLADMSDKIERSKLSQPTIDTRLKAIDAAVQAVADYQSRMNDAQRQETSVLADEGRGRARPGAVVDNTRPVQSTTESDMRRGSAQALADEDRFYAQVQADENSVRSTPNEMDPGLVKEAKPRVEEDGQGNLFTRNEMRAQRGPRSTEVSKEGFAAGPTAAAATDERTGNQGELFGAKGGPTKAGQRTGTVEEKTAADVLRILRRPGQEPAPARPAPSPVPAPAPATPKPKKAQVSPALTALHDLFKGIEQEVGAEEAKAPAAAPTAPAAPKPARGLDRRAEELVSAQESLRRAEAKYKALQTAPETSRQRRAAQDEYFDALNRVDAAKKALDQNRPAAKPAAESKPSEQSSALASAVDSLSRDQIEGKLAQPVTAQDKAAAKAEAAAVAQEESDTVTRLVDDYRAALGTASKNTLEREQRQRKLRQLASEIDGYAQEGVTAAVRKQAKAAIDDIVQDEHLPGLTAKDSVSDVIASNGVNLGLLRALSKTKTLGDALEAAMKYARNPGQRSLIRALLRSEYVRTVGFTLGEDSVGRKLTVGGTYDPLTHSVNINTVGGNIYTLLHEAVHAATVHAMYDGHFDPDTGEAYSPLARRIWKLMADAYTQAGRSHYGLSDPAEFIAEAMTNPQFQQLLRETSGEQRSLWDKLVTFVARLLGVPVHGYDALAEVMRITDVLMGGNDESARKHNDGAGAIDREALRDSDFSPLGLKAKNAEADRFDMPEPKATSKMAHAVNTVRAALTDWRATPGVLGWLSLRQLGERFGAESERVQEFVGASLRMGQRAEQIMAGVAKVVTPWRNLPAETQRALGKVMLEATMLQGHIDRAWTDKSNDHLRVASDPTATAENKAEFDRVKAQFDALPKAAQETYAQARDVMQRQWNDLAAARVGEIKRAFRDDLLPYFSDAELDQIVKSPSATKTDLKYAAKFMDMPRAARTAMRSMIEAADAHYQEASQMKGPYFPLVRFGDHVVVAKSSRFAAAQKAFRDAQDELQRLYDQEEPEAADAAAKFEEDIANARKAAQVAKRAMEVLKGEQRHYAVTFFEHRWEAENYQRQLTGDKARGLDPDPLVAAHGLEVTIEQRAKHYRQFDSASPQFMRRLEEQLRTALPKADLGAVQHAVREVYLRTLPDRAALKSELRRLNVAGSKPTEMMRGFATRAMGNAHRVSRMEYSGQMQDSLRGLRDSENRDERLVGEEFALRMLKSMMPPERNVVFERLAQTAHLTFLGMSPSYVLMNMMQPWAISAPIMAAKHGWAATGRALGDASLEVMGSLRTMRAQEGERLKDAGIPWSTARSFRFDIQPEQLGKTDAERRMLRHLFNDGLINITIEHDLGAVSSGSESNWFDKVNQMASTPAHLAEVVNRVATSLAAFRLETGKDVSESRFNQAVMYATKVVADTHLDYSGENAPRLMRPDSFGGLGRLFFQFKKYTQGMLYLHAKLLSQAVKGDKEAGRALAYLSGMTVALAGATGHILSGAVGPLAAAIAKLWDDDDEPNFGQMFYNGMKNAIGETAARAIWKGLPAAAGVDLSSRLGMQGIINPAQFVNWDANGRDLYKNILLGMSGPASAMMANWFDAAAQASTDPMRAWQLLAPKALSDPLKAFDRMDRGIVSRAGQEIVGADQFGTGAAALKALGMERTDISDMYENRSAINAAKTAKKDVRTSLVRRYLEAKAAGDDTGGILDSIAGYNRRNPHDKVTMSTLVQARMAHERQAKQMVGGASVSRRDVDVLDNAGIQ